MSAPISPPPSKRRKLTQANTSPSLDPSHEITVYSWNVNGIAPFLQPSITSFFSPSRASAAEQGHQGSALSLRNVLKRLNWPTMLFLQEVKISPDDQATQKAVERAVLPRVDEDPSAPSYRAFFCLPKDRHNARGFGRKVYGVCSIIRDDFFITFGVKVREVTWDLEGRFLVVETKARGDVPSLALFNCYMVNGTDAAYRDANGKVSGTRHDRKLRVHKLLQDECLHLESRGFCVVLAGDMNVARSKLDGLPNLRTHPEQHCINRADFESRFFRGGGDTAAHESEKKEKLSLEMMDSFRELHPQKAAFTYYPRDKAFGSSADRVDMIMLSRLLKESLAEAGMLETIADRGPSDHVPLFAKLRFT